MLPVIKENLGGLPRAYWVLWAGTLINRLGTFVLPLLQIYLTAKRGMSVDQAGLLISAYGVGGLLANPFGGALSDRIGRKPTMLISFAAQAVAMLALGFAKSHGELAVSLFVLGITADLFRPALMAVIADVVPPERRLRAFAHLYWAINLGSGVAPLVAGEFADKHFFALFVADASTTLACGLLVLMLVPETNPHREKAKGAFALSEFFAPFKDRAFLPYIGVSFLVSLVFFQFLAAMPADMTAHGLSAADFSKAIAVNGFLIVLVQPFTVGKVAKGKRAWVLAIAAALTGAGFGLNAFAQALPSWAFAVIVWTVAEIIMAPVNSSIVADLSPAHQRGRYQGAYNMAWSLSFIAAPALGTYVLQHEGAKVLWGGCFVVGLITAVLQWAIGPMRRRRMLELHGASTVD